MQNKPNLLDAQMNVSSVKTMNYEQITMNNANKNKPNTKPNKANFPAPRGETNPIYAIACTLGGNKPNFRPQKERIFTNFTGFSCPFHPNPTILS